MTKILAVNNNNNGLFMQLPYGNRCSKGQPETRVFWAPLKGTSSKCRVIAAKALSSSGVSCPQSRIYFRRCLRHPHFPTHTNQQRILAFSFSLYRPIISLDVYNPGTNDNVVIKTLGLFMCPRIESFAGIGSQIQFSHRRWPGRSVSFLNGCQSLCNQSFVENGSQTSNHYS